MDSFTYRLQEEWGSEDAASVLDILPWGPNLNHLI